MLLGSLHVSCILSCLLRGAVLLGRVHVIQLRSLRLDAMTHLESPSGVALHSVSHTTPEPGLAGSEDTRDTVGTPPLDTPPPASPSDSPQAAPATTPRQRLACGLRAFGRKSCGLGAAQKPSRRKVREAVLDGLFAGVGIASLAAINIAAERSDLLQLIASFGASAVLVYAAPASPLAQPRNLVGGNIVSAICGVAMSKAFHTRPDLTWLAGGLAVGLAVAFMGALGVTHPPAGATALIAVVGDAAVKHQGWLYIVQPVTTGSLFLMASAMLFNNVHQARSYPQYW
jgi:hypothetical protein